MTLGMLTFEEAQLKKKDFAGKRKNYPTSYGTFLVEVDDPHLVKKLLGDGVRLWTPENNTNNADAPHTFLEVRVDNRFGDVKIAQLFADGTGGLMPEHRWVDLDNLAIKSADFTVAIRRYPLPKGGENTAVFLRTMIVRIMSDAEKADMDRENDIDPIRKANAALFGE